MNFVKFLRTPFLQNTSGRLLLLFTNEELMASIKNTFYPKYKSVIKPANGKKFQLLFININHFAFIRIATLYNDGDDETTKTFLLRSTDLDMISR